jgi:hypothetical protein
MKRVKKPGETAPQGSYQTPEKQTITAAQKDK